MFNIVLFQPEIPQNTGNIVRTCAVTGSVLHLIKPLGFKIDEKSVKRAGLDYWDSVKINVYENFYEFLHKNENANIYLLTSKGDRRYCDVSFKDGDYLVFGQETKGLPKEIHEMFKNRNLRIPMLDNEKARCLNLSNSVCVVLYEALRQNNYFSFR